MGKKKGLALLTTAAIAIGVTSAAVGQGAPQYRFDVQPQELKFALRSVTREAGLQLFADADDLRDRRSPDLRAETTIEDALQRLLAGTGLHAEISGKAVFIRGRAEAGIETEPAEAARADIVVTGTHIRGEHPAAPVISLTRQQMVNAGETSLGDAVRNIPQSFGGGQNPNVLYSTGAGQANGNLNSASTINLRGLGPDATLTLINGHRISYDGASQAVDISAIPVAALDRLEIVADGASALYGSDAVGGVANIILRRDFEGLETDARLGGATDGGDFQQQYDAVTGRKWSSGGFILTYDFQRNTAVNADQRSITRDLNASTTLVPYQRQHSVVLSGHQSLSSNWEFSLDATFDHRNSSNNLAYSQAQPAQYYGILRTQTTTGFSIAPRVQWHAPHNWLIALSGGYGRDKAEYTSLDPSGGVVASGTQGRYVNKTKSIEMTGEGPLVALPAGAARLALGAGHRDVGLFDYGAELITGGSEVLVDANHDRSSNYGYGELFIPLVEPQLSVPAAQRLEATAAIRYESYNGIGNVATPKLGLVYSPISGLTFHGTWGRSYKTPTLYQQYGGYVAELLSPALLGASTLPAGSTILYSSGSNANLRPEKATTWTVGAKLQPRWLPGFSLEGSFFHVNYHDRIVAPPLVLNGLLSNPQYDQFITRDPDASLIDSLISGAFEPLINIAGVPFDPTKVVAFVNDQYWNVAHETVRGVDLSAEYKHDFDLFHAVDLSASATYLENKQSLSEGAAETLASGIIYYPPKWRARGGGTFTDHGFAASAFVNYIGPVIDDSRQPYVPVHAMTTVDVVLRLQSSNDNGVLRGLTMTIAASNLFNAMPARIRVSNLTLYPAYDSTNYSALGRIISVTLGKRW